MPTAVAAMPTPTTKLSGFPSLADGSSGSLPAEDFAALLLGQLTTDVSLTALTTGDSAATPAFAENPTAATDPALLLASLGLTGTPLAPPPTDATQPTWTSANPSAADATLTAAAGITASGQASAPATSGLSAAPGAESGQPALPEASSAGTAAKLAGFEQNLAEAQASNTEVTPQQSLSNAALAGQPTAHTRATGEQVRVDTPLKEPAWSGDFGQKVVWMATQDKQSAQITLNPPQLGPIEISLNVKNDQATAVFASGNAEVREAIEAALPRLREMLADAGVQLGQTNVSSESFRQQASGNGEGGNGQSGRNGDAQLAGAGLGTARGEGMAGTVRRGNGLVDTFA